MSDFSYYTLWVFAILNLFAAGCVVGRIGQPIGDYKPQHVVLTFIEAAMLFIAAWFAR